MVELTETCIKFIKQIVMNIIAFDGNLHTNYAENIIRRLLHIFIQMESYIRSNFNYVLQ